MRVVVIGAGLGGLSAAAHLSRSGHEVTVLERDSVPGGRAGAVVGSGFHLDNGPTVLTMPNLLADTFAAAGAEMADFVTIKRVDPMYRAVFADGSTLMVRHGREAMTDEIRQFANATEAAAFGRFSDWLEQLYRIEMSNFIDSNFDSVLDLIKPWRAALQLVQLGGLGRLGKKVASFFQDERLQRIFSFQSMYAGLAPYEALALYAVITYMDSVEGVFVPEGGMHQMASGLAKAVGEAGVTIHYDRPVTRILRGGDGAVTGVEVGDSDRYPADVVVCNVDLPVAYRTLVGGVDAPRVPPGAAGTRLRACCGSQGSTAHHRPERRTTTSISATTGTARSGHSSTMACACPIRRYWSHSSRSTTPLAPPGCTSMFVLEPTPNLDGKIDWSKERDRITSDLRSRVASLGYSTDVVIERVYDPLDWQRMGMARGTPFALAHTLRQTGPLRPNNVDKRVPGLVFTGSSTVPGVGVPMVLLSGKLAAERVVQYGLETQVFRW